MLSIYFARESVDKGFHIFSEIGKSLEALRASPEKGGRVLLVVPDQFTLQAERDAFFYLRRDGFLELEVISMTRLRHRVIEETGRDSRVPIGKGGRRMLLSLIIRRRGADLEAFDHRQALNATAGMMDEFISEMKQQCVSPQDLAGILSEEGHPILRRKLSDVLKVYEDYESMLEGKYLDGEDHLALLAERIPSSGLIAGSEIWLHGFDYLSRRDLEVVRALLARSRGLNVMLCADAAEAGRAAAGDSGIFRISRNIMGELAAIAESVGHERRFVDLNGSKAAPKRAEALRHVEKELFSYPFKPFGREAGEITLVSAASFYAEAESVAAAILKLVRDEGCRYRDILVICNDMETRAAVIKRVFSEYNLPLFIDRRKNLLHNPVLEYISALMDTHAGNWRGDDLIRLIKTGFSPLSLDEREMLEEYAAERRLKRRRDWLKPAGPDAAVEAARAALVGHVARFSSIMSKKESVREKTAAIYLFLRDEARLPEKLAAFIDGLRGRGRHVYADELSQLWDRVMEAFDQLAAALGEERLSGEDYRALLSAGLESIEIGLIPTTADQILLGTMQRTRPGACRALFVLGANDGILPAGREEKSLLSEDERERVFAAVDAGRRASLKADEEQLAIYRNMSRPLERLWVSYSVSDPDGAELRPSLIFDKLRRLFPRNAVEKDIRSGEMGLELVGTAESTLGHLSSAIRRLAEGSPDGKAGGEGVGLWSAVRGWYAENAPERLRAMEAGLLFSNRREIVRKDYVRRLYAFREGDAAGAAGGPPRAVVRLSPSGIERYARCPFAHFVAYGLAPKERRSFEIGPRERGDVFHRVLMEFSKELTEEGKRVSDSGSKWMGLTREACFDMVDRLLDGLLEPRREKAEGGEAGRPKAAADVFEVFRQGKTEEYRRGRIRDVARKAAWALTEQVKAGDIDDMFYEERFGEGGRFPPLIWTEGETEVRVEGRMDRLDVIGGRAKIIDYKSGDERFDVDEARNGWRLQLMLYLQAVTEDPDGERGRGLKPAGAFYFRIHEPRLDCGPWQGEDAAGLAEKAEAEARKSFRMDGVAVDDQETLRSIAGDDWSGKHYSSLGYSDIIPVRRQKGEDGEPVLVGSRTGSRKLLSEEEFRQFQRDVRDKVGEFCGALAGGVIDVAPGRTRHMTACRYCGYRGVCAYDPEFG
ncbi:MAG: exodeoxyribonuclease V subunit gamma [Clostridiales Family XIII bacterium]|jgi:ATP-dependent helicase/nuclease subunit B|nr:exodeoxyribonuclease V subunit gamma [Clostridiales Family XIII bacterium]